ncbi:hypothetical protein R6V09_17280 [Streptomyces sp. W16]|uniref:hypothetical protein n=1 Tax=Streptomyces sp. W16 TaxID=3076631 RepID=UPI00295ACD33|nr:hypothetical protein [Streptomyces sp. W16]MDV9171866.1 hypothetical protein [Streptomyces sp. W16]
MGRFRSSGFLRDWDRSLRAGNYPETTRYSYLLVAAQLGRYLGECSPDPQAVDAAEDPTDIGRAQESRTRPGFLPDRGQEALPR